MPESPDAGGEAPEEDAFRDDPFFKKVFDSDWNACIGRQGDEQNYLDGYLEAAIELSNAVIDKGMFEKRDTLVLPILYNARHALELVLKFTISELSAVRDVKAATPRNHDIQGAWEVLNRFNIGDEVLGHCVNALLPFVSSLSRIDDDGQELRYYRNQSDQESLSKYSVANLELIRVSLGELATIINRLRYRTMNFVAERQNNTYTNRCSRRDLLTIARIMPPISSWTEPIFEDKRLEVKERFKLSNRQFSQALDAIKANREMSAILGTESVLSHISDEKIEWAICQWRRCHPTRQQGADEIVAFNPLDPAQLESLKDYFAVKREVVRAIEERLSTEDVADLETVFYIGRDQLFCESYEAHLGRTKKQHAATNDLPREIQHLIEKTNFLDALRRGLLKLGRSSLALRLATM